MGGRISYLGGIVRDGLILDLDAAKIQSYPRTGTLWNDISGNQNNGTLINGPTFDSGNGGSIVFDGVNDYVSVGLNLSTYTQITVEIWVKLSNTLGVIGFEDSPNWNTNIGGFGLALNVDGFVNNPNICHSAYWSSGSVTARNYSFTCGTQNYSCHTNIYSNISDPTGRLTYVNGNLIPYTSVGGFPTTTTTIVSPSFRNDIMYFASRGGSSGFLNGNISLFKIYNRKLTATEVLQNYNATRGRFGL
jgi:hypothetical protein